MNRTGHSELTPSDLRKWLCHIVLQATKDLFNTQTLTQIFLITQNFSTNNIKRGHIHIYSMHCLCIFSYCYQKKKKDLHANSFETTVICDCGASVVFRCGVSIMNDRKQTHSLKCLTKINQYTITDRTRVGGKDRASFRSVSYGPHLQTDVCSAVTASKEALIRTSVQSITFSLTAVHKEVTTSSVFSRVIFEYLKHRCGWLPQIK